MKMFVLDQFALSGQKLEGQIIIYAKTEEEAVAKADEICMKKYTHVIVK